MPKFKLTSAVTVSAFTTVEADTLEDAIALAEDRPVVIGGINSGEDPLESWIIEEADGSALDIQPA